MASTLSMELLTHYTALIRAHGWPVYEVLPPEEEEATTPYPFVVIGEIDTILGGDKTALSGSVDLTIDVWGHLQDRPTVAKIAAGIVRASLGTWRTEHYSLTGQKTGQQIQMSTDTSVTNSAFVRAMVTLELQVN